MKRITLLTIISLAIGGMLLCNASGPGFAGNGNKTGSPGSAGTCVSCHSAGNGATATISIVKKSDNSNPNGKYIPGETYEVTLSGDHPSLLHWGFQLTAMKAGNTGAGTWQGVSGNIRSNTSGNTVLIEHNQVLPDVFGVFTVTVDWVAPAAGNGTVNFYGIINAVNHNGATDGDAISNTATVVLAEMGVNVNDVAKQELKTYPNPVKDILQIGADNNIAGECIVSIITIEGRHVLDVKKLATAGNPISINVKDLAKGVYSLSVYRQGVKHSALFVKQ
jgi:hypothetical protein